MHKNMDPKVLNTLTQVLKYMPQDWLNLTTHRLDIYNEAMAKVDFLHKLEALESITPSELANLPTAYDYIRLGHPLSCLLEWAMAKRENLDPQNVISFSSQVMPILAILRANKFNKKPTRIIHQGLLPQSFNPEVLKNVYSYEFELVENVSKLTPFQGSSILLSSEESHHIDHNEIDFNITLYPDKGSVVQVLSSDPQYVKEIQHVRRRESIAMTPQNCLIALHQLLGDESSSVQKNGDTTELIKKIQEITSSTSPLVCFANCGLSAQYGIMMGLVHHALEHHSNKDIKFIVPPNCYGGTNDQARRVAACIENVEIIDLPVDDGKDMVSELERILTDVAAIDAVPYIIGEIPTNPRVEIPELSKLRETLKKERMNTSGVSAIAPVFILDQTFCPNVKFFGKGGHLHDVKVISYVSGSKFPSGGLCTAGYAVANESAKDYMSYVEDHLALCDNKATNLQKEILTQEIPAMNERIAAAYKNTQEFVSYIEELLPEAKINFVSEELASARFTPSVFSLDLPTKGATKKEQDEYKQILNHKLINMMIKAIPEEAKHCVSYGQLKGSYWTIPATSTQGTTKESDKDYIVRVSIAADFNLLKHQEVFKDFVKSVY